MRILKTKKLIVLLFFALGTLFSNAANFKNLPTKIQQPDGTVIECFSSGDEFFNWLHDQDGYTIIQSQENGYYYYAKKVNGKIVPSQYLVGTVDASKTGLEKWTKISLDEYNKIKEEYFKHVNPSTKAPHTGTLNNLAVYIRFNDDSEFTINRQTYDNKFNPTSTASLKSYFNEVSYTNLNINTTHYPTCAMTTNLSYKDSHNRNYFQPYNASTNPSGYSTSSERTAREHQLLVDAINYVKSQIPTSLNLDGDNDGNVDNVCFIVRGNSGGWSDLLWAHRWVLYSKTVYINSKRVYDYTFQPENQNDVTTLCHEMFHALGSPDLYHYSSNGISPCSYWDLMEYGSGHMTAYMKWKYAGQQWISSIPEITTSGTYTLNPLTSSTNNCYKIKSPNSTSEYFVVEYRKKEGMFENNLPGSGLIVYRINPSVSGNANGPPDEVYIYRPNGTTTANGSPSSAHYSSNVGRTAINNTTNPKAFLTNGSNGDLNISNIGSAGSTISFDVTIAGSVIAPVAQFVGSPTTVTTGGSVQFTDQSSNTPTSWSWSFQGGTPATSTAQNPSVVYNTPGTYQVALTATNSAGSDTETKTGYITVSSSGCNYCSSTSNNASEEWISNVTFNTLNNSANSSSGYENFTNLSTDLVKGNTYTLSVSCGSTGSWTEHYWAFIDWNGDCDFLDAGESYDLGQASGASTRTLNITVPAGATEGTTRMRVSLKYNGDPTACESSFSYGQVEDYNLNIVSGGCTYCTSTSNNAAEEWISNVTFNNLNNSTNTTSGYEDFTSKVATLVAGNSYTISVSCGSTGSWTEHYWVFIDWNKDCDFNDAGESYDLGQASGQSTRTLSIAVPSDATGTTRMRVSLKYNGDPTGCEASFSYGQVEDYKISIGSSKPLSINETETKEIKVYPNPVNTILNVDLIEADCELRLFNTLGKQLLYRKADDTKVKIDVSNYPLGVYTLTISNKTSIKSMKFIKH